MRPGWPRSGTGATGEMGDVGATCDMGDMGGMLGAMPTPELLSPAGSLRMAETALAYGANAIYAGQPRYSLRVRNNEFGQIENLAAGIALVQGRGGKFYVVSNIIKYLYKQEIIYIDSLAQ